MKTEFCIRTQKYLDRMAGARFSSGGSFFKFARKLGRYHNLKISNYNPCHVIPQFKSLNTLCTKNIFVLSLVSISTQIFMSNRIIFIILIKPIHMTPGKTNNVSVLHFHLINWKVASTLFKKVSRNFKQKVIFCIFHLCLNFFYTYVVTVCV